MKDLLIDIEISSNFLSKELIDALGKSLKEQGYKWLTFTSEPSIGAYLTIDLENDID